MVTYFSKGNAPRVYRFDRKARFDKRSKDYDIGLRLAGREPVTKLWETNVIYDQEGGSCVAFAMAGEMSAEPVACGQISNEDVINKLYFPAQYIDDFPGGEYPDAYPWQEGTDLLSVLGLAVKYGVADSYEWAFSMLDIQRGISFSGPAIVGTGCYSGMIEPDRNGYIHPTGRYVGGHAYILLGVNMEEQYFTLAMAWGPHWCHNGRSKISFKDFDKLRRQKGECAFLIGRHLVDLANVVPPAPPPKPNISWWKRFLNWL